VGGKSTLIEEPTQDVLYTDAAGQYGAALERLAHAYETDPEKRRDLSQEIHFQLWRSFRTFDARCSLRTWVYRVAHHVAATHVLRERRRLSTLMSLEELERFPDTDPTDVAAETDRRRNVERLSELIQQLKPLDRQVIISYLEDLDAASIGEITGLSAASVTMRIHRIKKILARRFHKGGSHAE
jgi:RNA polymerase sigma-70 factor (ECF subfamily)